MNSDIVHYSKDIAKNLFLPATIGGFIFTLLRTAIKNFNQTIIESKISSNTERFIDYASLAFITGLGYLILLLITSKMNFLESGIISFLGVLFAMFILFLAKWLIIPQSIVEGRLKSEKAKDFNFKIIKKIGKDKYLCSKTETKDSNSREIYFFISNMEDYEFTLNVDNFSRKRKIIGWFIFILIILLLIIGIIFFVIKSAPN